MKYVLSLLFGILVSVSAFAQTGIVKGIITDSKTKEPIIGATVVLTGTTHGTATDLDGKFQINKVPVGKQSISVSYVSFKTKKIEVVVHEGKTSTLNTHIEEDVSNLGEVEISAARLTNTESSVVTEIRASEQVVSGVSSEQVAKTQDRDASEVIKRVPGITIMDNRFVMVRGLSERYNAVMLNDALIPSTENDVKAFSFDIIPSGMLDRLLIYKSAAPELPGEFAGGVIKVYTKTPTHNSLTINYSSSFRPGTTLNDYYSQQKSATDFLGYDNGTRTLPSGFPANIRNLTSNSELEKASKSLPNSWTNSKSTAMPDQRLALNFTKVINLGNDVKVGNVTSFNYTNAFQHYNALRNNYNSYNLATNSSSRIYEYHDDTYINNVRLGLLHNWSLDIGSKNKFEFRNMFNQMGSTQNTLRTGTEFEGGNDLKGYGYRYETRRIYMGQFHGEHAVSAGSKVEWSAGYANTNRSEPDFRRVNTRRPMGSNADAGYTVTLPPDASAQDASRFYSKANENLFMASGDWEQKLKLKSGTDKVPVIRAGFYAENKTKNFAARWMAYAKSQPDNFNNDITRLPIDKIFADENLNAVTGLVLREGTNPSDRYDAENLLLAAYTGTTIPMGALTISGGLRVEQNHQKLNTSTSNGRPSVVDNNILRALPSANLSYSLSEKSLVRLAYYRTLNRPEFRELAPFAYYDFNFNNVITGNPKLKTPSIDNLDARYEYYPSAGETVSFGAFYKKFTNPIESYFLEGAGSGGTRNFYSDNAEYSTSAGIEAEARKSLAGLTGFSFVDRFSVLVNASLIRSKVELGKKAVGQESSRPMMGQSPYAINAGIYYADEAKGLQINMLYNVVGKRIYAVGSTGTPDIYELPRNVLDLTLTKRVNRFLDIRLGVQDLLNNAVRLRQDSNLDGNLSATSKGDEDILSYKRGSYYTFGLQFNIQ
ncbi:MAG: carboxypeptidase-like regulatory domain-containing protein [Bacteroidota bacterium]